MCASLAPDLGLRRWAAEVGGASLGGLDEARHGAPTSTLPSGEQGRLGNRASSLCSVEWLCLHMLIISNIELLGACFIYFLKFLFILQPPPTKLNSCCPIGWQNFKSSWVTIFEWDAVRAVALAVWHTCVLWER